MTKRSHAPTRFVPAWLASAGSYLLLFGVLAWPWFRVASSSVAHWIPDDQRLIVWVLDWVAGALFVRPANLFDAPIFFPAPDQLASSEHFLSSQILYLPVALATGNPLLAANLAAFLTYPLAGVAMERLLANLGLWWGAAWVGGLAFALGAERLPANLHALQNTTFFLPLAMLCLLRLRRRQSFGRALVFLAAYVAALFSSYYMAVLTSVAVVAWCAFEAILRPRGVGRYLAIVATTAGVGVLLLTLFSTPYFRHRASQAVSTTAPGTVDDGRPGPVAPEKREAVVMRPPAAVVISQLTPSSLPVATLAVLALVLCASASRRDLRPVVLLGVCLWVLGAVLVAGGGGILVRNVPGLGFFRITPRYRMISSLGFAMLVAAGLAALRSSLGARPALLAVLASVLALLVGPARQLLPEFEEVRAFSADRRVYERVGEIAGGQGGGAAVELPFSSALLRDSSPDAMAGAVVHGLPLIQGYSGYSPPHRNLLSRLVQRLQGEGGAALADLVDSTHLRWLLVRPEAAWGSAERRRRFVERLAADPEVGSVVDIEGWSLVRIDRVPQHPEWFAALAQGPSPGRSLLGTSMAALDGFTGSLAVEGATAPLQARAGRPLRLTLAVGNRGPSAWPAVVPYGRAAPGQVYVETRWIPTEGGQDTGDPVVASHELERDVAPGERFTQPLAIPTPSRSGTFDLEIALRQRTPDAGGGPRPLVSRLPVVVAEPPVAPPNGRHPGK